MNGITMAPDRLRTGTGVRCALVLAAVLASACAGSGPIRFANRSPVWAVNDRQDVPRPPERRESLPKRYHLNAAVVDRFVRPLEVPAAIRASNVNSLDHVPDSTWFTNRMGLRPVDPDEIRRGPGSGVPSMEGPWTVIGGKTVGASAGFRIRDSDDAVFLLKFDEPDRPEAETGAEVVVQRIAWAAGYNVPANDVVVFRRDRLVLGEDARLRDGPDNTRPMTEEDIDFMLAGLDTTADGRFRALSSRFLSGVPLGGFATRGKRPDDPNDRVPHEHRRELRGLRLIYAWVDQVDVKEDNSLDMWQPDPVDPARHYVVHYLLDFGEGLGVARMKTPWAGFRFHDLEPEANFLALVTLGGWRQPWEDYPTRPNFPGMGRLAAAPFDPGKWRTYAPYTPFVAADRFDDLWAARIMAAFDESAIRAAVESGRYSDPRTVDHLVAVLLARRDVVLRYAFQRVAPLDHFKAGDAAKGPSLCAGDLAVSAGMRGQRLHVDAAVRDVGGTLLARIEVGSAGDNGLLCMDLPAIGPSPDYYTVVSLIPRDGPPGVDVHLARSPEGSLGVIGVHRR
jgi:hypothetical protein